MKKIVSLLMVISILALSFGTALAADYTGLKMVAEKVEDGLYKADIYVNHTQNIKSITVTLKLANATIVSASDKSTAVTATAGVAGSVTKGATVEGWAVQKTMYNASQKLYSFTLNDTSLAGAVFEDDLVATIYFKTTATPSEAITTATAGMFASYMMQLQVSASEIYKLSTNPELFTIFPSAASWEADDKATIADLTDLETIKVAGVAVDYVRAVAVFGKNAAGTTYTVKFGAIDGPGRAFEGEAVVGEPWAMVLYDDGSAKDENGKPVELISSKSASYPYTVNAGDATWSGTAAVITK